MESAPAISRRRAARRAASARTSSGEAARPRAVLSCMASPAVAHSFIRPNIESRSAGSAPSGTMNLARALVPWLARVALLLRAARVAAEGGGDLGGDRELDGAAPLLAEEAAGAEVGEAAPHRLGDVGVVLDLARHPPRVGPDGGEAAQRARVLPGHAHVGEQAQVGEHVLVRGRAEAVREHGAVAGARPEEDRPQHRRDGQPHVELGLERHEGHRPLVSPRAGELYAGEHAGGEEGGGGEARPELRQVHVLQRVQLGVRRTPPREERHGALARRVHPLLHAV
eukprot:scaffold98900_cov66-Phaeocystis_antarctica.AAC.1